MIGALRTPIDPDVPGSKDFKESDCPKTDGKKFWISTDTIFNRILKIGRSEETTEGDGMDGG